MCYASVGTLDEGNKFFYDKVLYVFDHLDEGGNACCFSVVGHKHKLFNPYVQVECP